MFESVNYFNSFKKLMFYAFFNEIILEKSEIINLNFSLKH